MFISCVALVDHPSGARLVQVLGDLGPSRPRSGQTRPMSPQIGPCRCNGGRFRAEVDRFRGVEGSRIPFADRGQPPKVLIARLCGRSGDPGAWGPPRDPIVDHLSARQTKYLPAHRPSPPRPVCMKWGMSGDREFPRRRERPSAARGFCLRIGNTRAARRTLAQRATSWPVRRCLCFWAQRSYMSAPNAPPCDVRAVAARRAMTPQLPAALSPFAGRCSRVSFRRASTHSRRHGGGGGCVYPFRRPATAAQSRRRRCCRLIGGGSEGRNMARQCDVLLAPPGS